MHTRAPAPITNRDGQVVQLVGRFGQLTSQHVQAVVFHSLAGPDVAERRLTHLIRHNYLHRMPRVFGGNTGGSSRYVYQLGAVGWRYLERPGKYWRFRAVDGHRLNVADIYCDLLAAERAGAYRLEDFSIEGEAKGDLGGVTLAPDAFVHLVRGDLEARVLLEVETGSHHVAKLVDKCRRYWVAARAYPDGFPAVVFTVHDVTHGDRVREAIRQATDGAAGDLFRVVFSTAFPHEAVNLLQ